MAVTPLYNTKEGLLNRIRMAITVDVSTLAVVDMAISQVRASFFNRLGMTRALQIATYVEEENPVSAEENLRGIAAITEALWVSYVLIPLLPSMHLETQYAIKNNFDDQPLTRDAPSLEKYIKTLYALIESNLGLLVTPENTVSGAFQSFSTGAKTPYLIGENHIGKGF